ncbi:MAG: hypothetical protein GX318_03570 [Clostridia bacterium]|nr:hypothetical protein [Clostridia bacterium]
MVDTSNQAELQNCIRLAQDHLEKMGPLISGLSGEESKIKNLQEANAKAGRLLREAQERCERLM